MAYGGGLGGMLGWMFLPQLVATYTLKLIHGVLSRVAPRMVPHPNTPQYQLHQRMSYVLVIIMYFAYSLWETEKGLGNNYYHMLGVTPADFVEGQLRRNFRRISLVLHPDKNPGHERQFIIVQEAYTVLSSPVMRFIYNHAGAEATKCQSCATVSDFMLAAIPKRMGMYIAYTLGNAALQVFGIARYGTYWRYIAIGAFAALELMMMASTSDPLIIRALFWMMPHRTGYELSKILQQAMVCFFIGLNQIGPQLIPYENNVNTLSLAKELVKSINKVKVEVNGNLRRTAAIYHDTGLKQHLHEQLQKEMQLGATLGMKKEFQDEYSTRLNNERINFV
ncbi:hypothetical protein IW140_001386 [Coemansia sp. RSA 1813]|nr:hypothetical protein EV178_001032 [Coemansia sp. RSA 1646]KAJ1772227.1 hypothetical protein LPJ74_001657 [Coemansia sp. RSA 1843]KAJ2091859.1 hypothetical protein IW138_001548 [Coemansia sp. RSA 986]KAJ2215814.1 hypothetical protein EV179_001834 [Coemansia sp. RSA 487]KAJ2571745.1 hypothetical protein IW140_001386 [Coemansia sp. RSA 1813]